MAEAERFTFSYKEIAEALIKKQGIHKGIWGLYVQFGIGAGHAISPEAQGEGDVVPTAFVPLIKMGLQKFKEENNLSVDAAKVNPPSNTKSSKKKAVGK